TWNSLGTSITESTLLATLHSLTAASIYPHYLILDDGWLDICPQTQKLCNFTADPHKFPNGLRHTIQLIKHHFPWIRHVGVWHTIWGYWNGVTGELAKKFPCVEVKKKDGGKVNIVHVGVV